MPLGNILLFIEYRLAEMLVHFPVCVGLDTIFIEFAHF